MWFWIFMSIFNCLMPATMLFFGYYFRDKAPARINTLFGYRTAMSMLNRDTWKFAHEYCGRLWIKLGWISGAIAVIVSAAVFGRADNVIGITGGILETAQCLLIVASIFPTEKALKKTFDEYGICLI